LRSFRTGKIGQLFCSFYQKAEKANIFGRSLAIFVFRDLNYKRNAKRGSFSDVHKKFTNTVVKTEAVL